MRRYTKYLFTALITFAAGFASVLAWQNWRTPTRPPAAQNGPGIDQGVIDPRWVYINRDIKWRPKPPPPPEIISHWKESNPDWEVSSDWKETEAYGTLVIFYPSGDYAEVSAALWGREDTPAVDFAPNGETSFHTYRGKWSVNPDGTISTFAIFSHVGMYNARRQHLPDARSRRWVVHERAADRLGTVLEAGGEVFVPSSQIEDFGRLTNFVKDWEKEPARP
jgi:hypothetical protein